jgi:hypothetical protein
LGEDKMIEWRKWFDSRLDDAIEAAELESQIENATESMLNIYIAFHLFKNDCKLFLGYYSKLLHLYNFLEGNFVVQAIQSFLDRAF